MSYETLSPAAKNAFNQLRALSILPEDADSVRIAKTKIVNTLNSVETLTLALHMQAEVDHMGPEFWEEARLTKSQHDDLYVSTPKTKEVSRG